MQRCIGANVMVATGMCVVCACMFLIVTLPLDLPIALLNKHHLHTFDQFGISKNVIAGEKLHCQMSCLVVMLELFLFPWLFGYFLNIFVRNDVHICSS